MNTSDRSKGRDRRWPWSQRLGSKRVGTTYADHQNGKSSLPGHFFAFVREVRRAQWHERESFGGGTVGCLAFISQYPVPDSPSRETHLDLHLLSLGQNAVLLSLVRLRSLLQNVSRDTSRASARRPRGPAGLRHSHDANRKNRILVEQRKESQATSNASPSPRSH